MKNSLYLNIVDKVIDSSNRNSQFDYFDYSKPSDWEWLIKEYIYNTKESRKPHYDNDQAGKQIIREGDSWNEKNVFQKNVDLKFSFPDWKYDELNQCQRSSVRHSKLSIFTEEQQEQAKRSLEAWSDVANINFTEPPPMSRQILHLVIILPPPMADMHPIQKYIAKITEATVWAAKSG